MEVRGYGVSPRFVRIGSLVALSLLAMVAPGQTPYSDAERKLADPRTDARKLARTLNDEDLLKESDPIRIRQLVSVRAVSERLGAAKSAQKTARQVKTTLAYRDAGPPTGKNWLTDALDRLKNVRPPENQSQRPEFEPPALDWLRPVGYLLLLAGGVAFVVFLLRSVRFSGWKRRAKTAILGDEEVHLTLDEWLERARSFRELGDFRNSIRALYVACLVRLDNSDVIEFIPSQTNWEHLRRFENSPRRPDFALVVPTRLFDEVWYGTRTATASDCDELESRYLELGKLLEAGR